LGWRFGRNEGRRVILVDTSVWIDYFNGVDNQQTAKLDGFLSSTVIVAGDLIVAELLQGFRHDKDVEIAQSLLAHLEQAQLCNTEIAIKSAQNYRLLRKQGITVRKTIDCLIATYCIKNEMPLLFSDRDFQPFVAILNLKDALNL
jgi:predicted nucleic acid-binding protein